MRKIYMFFVALAIMMSCGGSEQGSVESADVVCEEVLSPLGFNPDSLVCVEGNVKNSQFFSTLLGSLGMSAQEAYNLTQASSKVFDVKTLRVGNSYKAYYSDSGSLEYLVYDRSRTGGVVFSLAAE